ncbi:MAG: DMT family transporter [Meiothermus sp.]|nr:DMT family transporter [Meiothermus sp.]
MKPGDLAILFLLAAIWAASFLLARVVTPVLGTFPQVEGRLLLAGLILLVYLWWIGGRLEFSTRWFEYLVLGATNAAIPFTLIAFSVLHINASMATILNALAPLFSALIAALWLRERFTVGQVLGLQLGIVGVGILVGWSPVALGPMVLLSIGAGILAALCFGFSTVFARRYSRGAPLSTVTGQLLFGAMLLAAPAMATLPAEPPSPSILRMFLLLALVATALGNLLFFHLINSAGPTQAGSVGFLIPAFGLLWGYVFLDEPITWSLFAGMALILLSVALVNRVFSRPATFR